MKGAAFSRFLALVGVLAGVVSCGGGTDLAGIGGTGITSDGTISGFGSVFVNGVEYDTSGAKITVDGVSGKTQGDLKIGMVVTVKGTLNADGVTGTASDIVYRNEVKGPIANLDPATCQFEVLGLSVTTDSLTVFRDSTGAVITCADFVNGDVVEVSGFRIDPNIDPNTVRATHVERKLIASTEPLEVTGQVKNLDAVKKTFTIGSSLVVDFSSLPASAFAEGDFVEVKGTLNLDGTLQATSIEVEDEGFSAGPGEEVELEGIVTGFDPGAGSFNIGSQRVRLAAGATFKYGDMNTLALPNVRVEVEGTIVDGVLVAEKVEIRREAPYEIKGTVQAVSGSAGTITIMNMGRTITIDNLTQFEDESSSPVYPFGLQQLRINDYVEVDAFLDPASSKVVATRIEREDRDSDALKGPVDRDSVNSIESTFKILDITVIATSGTHFKDQNDLTMTGVQFFDRLGRNPASVVSVDGTFSSGSIVAEEIEFKE